MKRIPKNANFSLLLVVTVFGCGEREVPDFRPGGGGTAPEVSQNWLIPIAEELMAARERTVSQL